MGAENGVRYVSIAWLLGILTMVLIALAGATATEMKGDIRELKAQASQAQVWRAETAADRARLERIERKLDRLLEHQP